MSTVPPGPRRAPAVRPAIVQRAGDCLPAAPFEQPEGERWWQSLLLWLAVMASPPAFVLLVIAFGGYHGR